MVIFATQLFSKIILFKICPVDITILEHNVQCLSRVKLNPSKCKNYTVHLKHRFKMHYVVIKIVKND